MRRVLSAFAWLLCAFPAGAQQRPRSDSLPRELVIALLGGSLGGRNVEVRAGMADDSLPADLFRDALLLGFADYRVSSTTVAYFPYAPQATIDTIKARLSAAGWTVPPQPQDTTRGFVQAFGGSVPQVICRESSVVVPTVMIRTLNRTLAVISRQREGGMGSFCSRDPGRMYGYRNPAQDTPLPSLPEPPGMQSRGSGSSGVPDRESGMTMETSLIGAADAQVILAHYEAQFTASGWRKTEQVLAKSIGVATFEISAKGVSWYCALVVSAPAPDAAQVHLSLRMK
jgi:hypothetical protein